MVADYVNNDANAHAYTHKYTQLPPHLKHEFIF